MKTEPEEEFKCIFTPEEQMEIDMNYLASILVEGYFELKCIERNHKGGCMCSRNKKPDGTGYYPSY
jgi:hypothetical protein